MTRDAARALALLPVILGGLILLIPVAAGTVLAAAIDRAGAR